MVITVESLRRRRKDICTGCGWGMVADEDGYQCQNAQCFHVSWAAHRACEHSWIDDFDACFEQE